MVNRQTNQAIPFTYESDESVIDLPHLIEPQVRISQKEYYELKWRAGLLKSLHERSVSREQRLKEVIKEKDAKIRDLTKRLYGRSSEKKSGKKREQSPSESSPKNPRGQQLGSKGHGRTKRPNLPEKNEEQNFSELPICDVCGKPYVSDGNEEDEIFEFEVRAHKRRIKRQCVKKGCSPATTLIMISTLF